MVLGLLVAPGLAHEVAEELAEDLPRTLEERFPDYSWRVELQTELRAGPAGIGVDLVKFARERMLDEGWDRVICLTELPLRVGRRPVTAYASVALGVGVVSVPALGAIALESRVREAVLRLVAGLLGEDVDDGATGIIGHAVVREKTFRFVTAPGRGNVRLLVGMVRANRPWELIVRLSRALAAALGGAAFAIVSTGVWKVADGAGAVRLAVLTVLAVVAICASLIVAHDLWERSPPRSPAARERVVLVNVAVTLTILIGVATLFLALLAINAVTVSALIPREVLADELGHEASARSYLHLAWLLSSLATIGGALGAVIENELAVREAVFGYRGDASECDEGGPPR
jgi:hypothetical protein